MRALALSCPDALADKRDRALLLLGFAGAFRRLELVGLCWSAEDVGAGYVEVVAEGLRVRLHRSKTNQLGALEEVAICRGVYAATCPVRAPEEWRDALLTHAGQLPFGPVVR